MLSRRHEQGDQLGEGQAGPALLLRDKRIQEAGFDEGGIRRRSVAAVLGTANRSRIGDFGEQPGGEPPTQLRRR